MTTPMIVAAVVTNWKFSDKIGLEIEIEIKKLEGLRAKKTHHGDREVYADNWSPVGGWQARHHLWKYLFLNLYFSRWNDAKQNSNKSLESNPKMKIRRWVAGQTSSSPLQRIYF